MTSPAWNAYLQGYHDAKDGRDCNSRQFQDDLVSQSQYVEGYLDGDETEDV